MPQMPMFFPEMSASIHLTSENCGNQEAGHMKGCFTINPLGHLFARANHHLHTFHSDLVIPRIFQLSTTISQGLIVSDATFFLSNESVLHIVFEWFGGFLSWRVLLGKSNTFTSTLPALLVACCTVSRTRRWSNHSCSAANWILPPGCEADVQGARNEI